MKLHLYTIAAAFGDPEGNKMANIVSGSWMGPNVETACAQFVSRYYFDGGPRHHALIGVSAMEITEEALKAAIAVLQAEDKPTVVPLQVVSGGDPLPDACAICGGPGHAFGTRCPQSPATRFSDDPA